MRLRSAALAGSTLAIVAAPALASIQPVRRILTPSLLPARLSGVSAAPHVALTFDDGPDQRSTPAFLDLLAGRSTLATFFVLGRHATEEPGLLRRMVDEGHEIGVHGWTHRCAAVVGPATLTRDLRRTRDVVEETTGAEVRWYRPPYGVLTTPALVAARRAGLDTVLWSAWGVDWRRGRTPEQILETLERDLWPGGTVLLHDSDRTSAPGSWRASLAATETLLGALAESGASVGPLRDHWPAA